jgi:hypothetical protein
MRFPYNIEWKFSTFECFSVKIHVVLNNRRKRRRALNISQSQAGKFNPRFSPKPRNHRHSRSSIDHNICLSRWLHSPPPPVLCCGLFLGALPYPSALCQPRPANADPAQPTAPSSRHSKVLEVMPALRSQISAIIGVSRA